MESMAGKNVKSTEFGKQFVTSLNVKSRIDDLVYDLQRRRLSPFYLFQPSVDSMKDDMLQWTRIPLSSEDVDCHYLLVR